MTPLLLFEARVWLRSGRVKRMPGTLAAVAVTSHAQPHPELHFTGSELVSGIVIGMSDGLTELCALAAGLSGPCSRLSP